MKILITGSAGFIGFHLAERLLSDGHSVVGVDQVNSYYDVNLKKDRLAFSGISWNDKLEEGVRSTKYENYIFYRASLEDKTNINSIYAIGDVTDKVTLTPVAINEGHAFADREFGNKERFISYDNIPSAVFSQPSIAVVGFSQEEAIKKGYNVTEFKSEFRALKNTVSGNLERTLMKLIVDDNSQKVIGAHMIGPDSAEIIQGIAIAIKAGALKSDFDSTIGIHPSAAEEFVTMRP